MTAEAVLENHFGSEYWTLKENNTLPNILNAMEEYAGKRNPEIIQIGIKEELTKEEIEQMFKDFHSQPLQFVRHIDKQVDLVLAELARAEAKHPKWPTDIIHQAAIVAEESGEAVQAALQFVYEGGTMEDLKKELVQTATVALRMLKNLPE